MTAYDPAWLSLGRLHFRIPPGWEGPSEISYRVVSPNKQHLTWSPADFGEDEVGSYLEEIRGRLSDAFDGLDIGPVTDVENPYWTVSGFIAEFTGDQAPIALGTHVVQRPGAPLVLRSRLQGPDRGALWKVLYSVAPWVQGVPLAHDRDFFVFGCTFTSPLELLEMRTTHATSADGSVRLDVTWRDDAPQFSEPDWRRLCPSEQSAVLQSRDTAWIESGAKRRAIAGTEGLSSSRSKQRQRRILAASCRCSPGVKLVHRSRRDMCGSSSREPGAPLPRSPHGDPFLIRCTSSPAGIASLSRDQRGSADGNARGTSRAGPRAPTPPY